MPLMPFRSGSTPWQELRDLREQMDRIIQSTFRGGPSGATMEWAPPVDITEKDGDLVLTAELPGIKKDDIEVEIENNVLTIRGEKKGEREERGEQGYIYERQFGSFTRSFTLPRAVDPSQIRARFENGVLTVTMPKAAEARGQRVTIEEGDGGR